MANQNYRQSQNTNARNTVRPANSARSLTPVRQDFVIHPRLEIESVDFNKEEAVSTRKDFQPKAEEITVKTKREKRIKQTVIGALVILFSIAMMMPYVLSALRVDASALPVKLIPSEHNVLLNIKYAIQTSVSSGWTGDVAKSVWVQTIPSLILAFGILFVIFNAIKALIAMIAGKKQRKYFGNALVNLLCVAVLFIISLVGAPTMGVSKLDFMNDVIYGYATCEVLWIFAISLLYAIVSGILTLASRDRRGY